MKKERFFNLEWEYNPIATKAARGERRKVTKILQEKRLKKGLLQWPEWEWYFAIPSVKGGAKSKGFAKPHTPRPYNRGKEKLYLLSLKEEAV